MGWVESSHQGLIRLLLVVGSLQGALGATAWLPGQYPNPIKYPEACGRGESVGWVCDPDRVLSRDDADLVCCSIFQDCLLLGLRVAVVLSSVLNSFGRVD